MLAEDLRLSRIATRLLPEPEASSRPLEPDWQPARPFDRPPVAAAVLIALVQRGPALSILYTLRSASLRSHSGQVAFPGGKIDPTDRDPAAAALREAAEEVALDPADARILGYLPNYYTGTNYLITPVVAAVRPRRPFAPNAGEVDAVFEVPLPLIARPESFGTYRLTHNGKEHATWLIDHGGHRIWGITANLTRSFADRVLAQTDDAPW